MRKLEKFLLLGEYYTACRNEAELKSALPDAKSGDGTLILYRSYKAKTELLEMLVAKFYAGRQNSQDAFDIFRELRDVRKTAEKDAALKEWTTEKTLWNKFEGDCIDDDEEERAK